MSILTSITNNINRRGHRALLLGQKYSPEILTVAGIGGVVASTILIARAAVKSQPVVEEIQERLYDVKSRDDLEQKERGKEIAHVYVQGALKLARHYGPGISLGIVSLVSIASAHGILKKRNFALMAAYKAVETSFSEYRKRVAEEVGEEKEDLIFRRLAEVKTGEVDEKGKPKKEIAPHSLPSEYARWFDEFNNAHYEKNAHYNLTFLRAQQDYANNRLVAQGHLFLNDVYKALGYEPTPAGQVVGWLFDDQGEGDGFVDFGLYDGTDKKINQFINGDERAVLLDFNVDGVIWDKI